ncbi:MAG: hypothetical protein Q7S88_03215, partial [Candidatus Daviesbacteria bacterium]|nr:hypothetical protein [Candidatus Daviesbacteria bacterium]
ATLGDSLKEDGWDVVRVGNATLKGVKQTIVRVKKEASDLAYVLVSDLKGDFEASISADLKETETVDAEVVIGER